VGGLATSSRFSAILKRRMFLKVLARACFTGILGGRGGKGRGAKETSETPEFWQEASVADESSIWITEEGGEGEFL